MQNINSVVVTGNLTRDPELRSTGSGMAICSMRIAVNGRKKNHAGEWVDDPNFFDVTVWGATAENCARFLSKGRPVAIDGRLDWQEWEDRETGQRRSRVQIVAQQVQFLGGRDDDGGGFSGPRAKESSGFSSEPSGFSGAGFGARGPSSAVAPDDDIPF